MKAQENLHQDNHLGRLLREIPLFFNQSPSDKQDASKLNFDEASGTKMYCLLSLLIGSALALLCLSSGLYFLATEPMTLGLPTNISPLTQELVILMVNVILTLCIDGMMFIHSVSLRWALYHENRLEYNTNIRLLTSSSKSGPNRWYSNAATLFFLVLSYASSSTLLPLTDSMSHSGDESLLNATALVGLGIALAGQAAIATWCLVSNCHSIPTWSSNPLNTTLAAIRKGTLTRRPGRSMLSVHQKHRLLPEAVRPAKRQKPMLRVQSAVPCIVIFLWLLAFVAIAWLISIILVARKSEPACWRFAIAWKIGDDCSRNWVPFLFNDSETFLLRRYTYGQQTILSLLFICAIQGVQTLGLHCVELLVNLSRDETVWRRGYSSETTKQAPGLKLSQSPLVAAVSSWENMMLLLAKAVLHWAASQAMLAYVSPRFSGGVMIFFVYSRLALYTLLALLLALFATYLALRRPDGCQPTTLGHLQTIADLVDDWKTDDQGRIWWGGKTQSFDTNSNGEQIQHAGTSCNRRLLSSIDTEAKYS
ncbi:hypothetical protein CP533_5038 [Ophiocordyceps camponoti-saundersi (nom. inval.)]|nr:hypothetical protein CP533_5038 [Ophiocordyceps camponoti-saundersi (nom. inval.)]